MFPNFQVLHTCQGKQVDKHATDWRCVECGYVRRTYNDGRPPITIQPGDFDPLITTHAGSMNELVVSLSIEA